MPTHARLYPITCQYSWGCTRETSNESGICYRHEGTLIVGPPAGQGEDYLVRIDSQDGPVDIIRTNATHGGYDGAVEMAKKYRGYVLPLNRLLEVPEGAVVLADYRPGRAVSKLIRMVFPKG